MERCVQTSAVYLMGGPSQFSAPPSPPSPAKHAEKMLCEAVDDLSLDKVADSGSEGSRSASPTRTDDTPARLSSPATVPGSPPSGLQAAGSPASKLDPVMSPDLPPAVAHLAGALHVLNTEAAALQSVAQLYATSDGARDGFHRAVEAIVGTQTADPPGKLVIIGVGKSGHIGKKLSATFNSLAISSSFVHPTEALHGDLGHIRPHDALLFITYSGKTQELVSLLPHLDPALPLILLTAHVTHDTCALIQHRHDYYQDHVDAGGCLGPTILLPAPIHEDEKLSFGVAAPTTSTTTALAVGDALAIVSSKAMHPSVHNVFRRNHPGGAIGATNRGESAAGADDIRHMAVPWADIPVVDAVGGGPAIAADMLRAGYNPSARGWVRVNSVDDSANAVDAVASPSRLRSLSTDDLSRPVHAVPGLVVARPDFVIVSADTKARSAAEWLRAASPPDSHDDVVVAIVEPGHNGKLVGVLELQDLLQAHAL